MAVAGVPQFSMRRSLSAELQAVLMKVSPDIMALEAAATGEVYLFGDYSPTFFNF